MKLSLRKHQKQVEVISSDEEKLEKVQQLLDGVIKHPGKLFKPTTEFYNLNSIEMTEKLLEWLGITVEYDVLWIEVSAQLKQTGLYFQDETGRHHIYVNSQQSQNSYERAAVLAHELMHFILIGGLNFRLKSTLDNEKLTDMATIYAGFGLVVLNGFSHQGNNWAITSALLLLGVIHYGQRSKTYGYYKGEEYGGLVGNYLDSYNLGPGAYAGYVLPGARHFLPNNFRREAKNSNHKTGFVLALEKSRRKKRIVEGVITGIVAIILVAAIASSNNSSSNSNNNSSNASTPQSQALDQQKSQLDNLYSQLTSCQNQVNQDRQNVDNYSQSSVDTFNQEVDSCNTLLDQYNTQKAAYNQAVNNYNNSQ